MTTSSTRRRGTSVLLALVVVAGLCAAVGVVVLVRSSGEHPAVRPAGPRPAAPRHVSVVRGDESATLRWDRVDTDDLRAYRVYDVTNPAMVAQVAGVAAPARGHRVTGLTNGETYTYVVRALDRGDRLSPRSEPVTVTPRAGAR